MDDKQKIKILKTLLIVNSSMVVALRFGTKQQAKALIRMGDHLMHVQDKLIEANGYIRTMENVLHPNPEQIKLINAQFDLLKFGQALK